MKNRTLWLLKAALVIALIALVHWRSDGFSPRLIGAVAVEAPSSPHYRYLAKGKQCFVFESEDRKTVLKFFNQAYFQEPFYISLLPAKWAASEKQKRNLRRQTGYELAFQEQILSTAGGGVVYLTDRAGRYFSIDLSQVAFIEQKKGTPFYPTLEEIYAKEGEIGLQREITRFVDHIARRMARHIADRDHNVEDNWGYVEGVLFHLDPGRLYRDDSLLEPQKLEKQWWSTTHRFRKWLEKRHPESVSFLDSQIQARLNASTAVGEITPNNPNGMMRHP